MDIKARRLDGANAVVETKIDNKMIKAKEERILKALAKDAKIDGFRKGKVPSSILIARYGEKVRTDAEQEAVKELYDDALAELELDEKNVLGEPVFSKFTKGDDGEIDIELKIAYKPQIVLKGYEECVPDFEIPKVTKKEIDDRINELVKSNSPLKSISSKRGLKNGDFAVIDFEGFIEEAPFEGGKAENYTLEIGSKSFMEGFEEGLIGLKAGDSKEINVTFPKEARNQDLAGKDAVFKVKLHEIKQKDTPKELNEEILKKFLPNESQPTIEMFEEKVREQIKKEKVSKLYHEDLKPKFVEAVIKKFQFDLPENIVEREMDVLFRNAFATIEPDEIEEYKKDTDKVKAKRESYRQDAKDSVRLTFIVNELALLNNIDASEQEVMHMIYLEAIKYGQMPKVHFENYKKQGVLPAIKMAIIEDKLFQSLFDKAGKGKR